MYSQTRVKATIFVSARTGERRLGHSMVLGVEMVDNLVARIRELMSDRQPRQRVYHGKISLRLPLANR
jgi:hypothetical protein